MAKVTDPALLAQLDGGGGPVTDPAVLAALDSPALPQAPPQSEAAIRGLLQGASLGWADEAAAAVDAALPSFLRNETSREAVGQGETFGDRYASARDFYRGRNTAAREAHPATFTGNELAGAVAPALLTGGKALVARGAPLLSRAASGAVRAAPVGTVYGAGASEADTAGGVAQDAALGGAAAATLAGALPVAGTVARWVAAPLAARLGSGAETAAVRATNADRTAMRRALKGSDSARHELGRAMLDEPKMNLRSPQAIRDSAASIRSETGKEIGRLAADASRPAPLFHGSPARGLSELRVSPDARSGRALGPGVYASTSPTEAAGYAGQSGAIYQLTGPTTLLALDAPIVSQGPAAQAARAALAKANGGKSLVPAEQMTGFDVYRELSAVLGRDGAAKALAAEGIEGLAEGTKRVFFDPRSLSIAAEHANYASAEVARKATSTGVTVDLGAAFQAALASRNVAGLGKNAITRSALRSHGPHGSPGIENVMDDWIKQHGGKVTPSTAHDIRMQIDALANWDQAAPKAVVKAWRSVRSAVDDALDAAMTKAGTGAEWSAANARHAAAAKLTNSGRRGLADIGTERRQGNRLGSPSEKASAVAGGLAATVANPAAAIAIPAATVALNRFFFPVAARTADAASRGLGRFAASAARPAATQAAAVSLDPQMAALMEALRPRRMPVGLPVGAAEDQ